MQIEQPKGRKEDGITTEKPPTIPGEGVCRFNNKIFENNQKIDPRKELQSNDTNSKYQDPCIEICYCFNSNIVCDKFICDKPKNENCKKLIKDKECCPQYVCGM